MKSSEETYPFRLDSLLAGFTNSPMSALKRYLIEINQLTNCLSVNYLEEVAVGEVVVLLLPRRLGNFEVECVEVREEGGVLLRMRIPHRLALGEEVAPLLDPLQLPRTVTVPVT